MLIRVSGSFGGTRVVWDCSAVCYGSFGLISGNG
jgi:hypothetical protein